MRRALFVGLWLLGASPALAQQGQSEDDEKPGSRAAQRPSEPVQPDSPPSGAATKPALERTVGESPVNLRSDPKAAAEGVYEGVTIGGDKLPPQPPKLPLKSGPQRMTWPGFQVRDGVPTVFLQTTGTPSYDVQETPGTVVVTLRGTTIKLRNNQRPLKVGEFGTDITEIAAKPRGKNVVVTIKRKAGSGHRERVEPSAGGFSLLVVELPK